MLYKEIRKRPMLSVLVCFVIGVISVGMISEYERYGKNIFGIIFAAWILLIIVERKSIIKMLRENRSIFLLLLFMLFLGSGYRGALIYLEKIQNDKTERFFQENTYVKGVFLIKKSDKSDYGQKLEIENNSGRFLMYISEDNTLCAGLEMEVEGYLEALEKAMNPGEFDAEEYYHERNIEYQITVEKYRLTGKVKKPLTFWMMLIREKVKKSLRRSFSKKHAGILTAMLLGDRSELPRETRVLYQKSGIAHVLAISGMHVALIGNALATILGILGMKKKSVCIMTGGILFLYGIMTGFSTSTIRAIIIVLVSNWGRIRNRVTDIPTSLILAMFVISIIQPKLLFSSGTLMSFAAAGAAAFSNDIYNRLYGRERFLVYNLRARKIIKYAVVTSVSMMTMNMVILPLIVFFYYEMSPYSILLNLILVPMLTAAVMSGFITAVIGLVPIWTEGVSVIGKICGKPAGWILDFYEIVCTKAGRLPFANINTGHISVGMVFLFESTALIGTLLVVKILTTKKKNERRIKGRLIGRLRKRRGLKGLDKVGRACIYSGFCVAMMTIMVFSAWIINETTFRMTFLYVGQGDGCIIHIPFQGNYVVDCGSSDRKNVGEKVLIPALKYYGMSRIDGVFISHPDFDHISGIYDLVNGIDRGIRIKNIYMSDENEKLKEMVGLLKYHVNIWETVAEGDWIEVSKECSFEVLFPIRNEKVKDRNDHSMVVDFKYKKLEVLFTGDIEEEGEQMLMKSLSAKRKAGKMTILKCPHHGSKTSLRNGLLEWTGPQITVISCGINNSYNHPNEETIRKIEDLGSEVYQTDKDGAVEVVCGNNGILCVKKWEK